MVVCSVPTTLSTLSPVPVTTGPRAITPKVLNWSIAYLTLCARRLKAATAFKVSRLPTLLVAVPVPVWAPFLFPRFVKNTQIV
ncbi:hypothetical protein BDF19DRAFT_432023 [Syncephalis fuscata]|nr:hypothetical protein BDF19DRAFT_432023 [Syncephalis fuscata]